MAEQRFTVAKSKRVLEVLDRYKLDYLNNDFSYSDFIRKVIESENFGNELLTAITGEQKDYINILSPGAIAEHFLPFLRDLFPSSMLDIFGKLTKAQQQAQQQKNPPHEKD